MSSNAAEDITRPFRRYGSKTPEITVFFWILKILASAAGGVVTALLTTAFGLGLAVTTMLVITTVTVVMLIQFSVGGYRPRLYWLAVVLLSVLGNLIVDNLTDVLDVPLAAVAGACAVLLPGTFAAWRLAERTLSIHTIDTTRREAFYWFAVLVTFAGGSAAAEARGPSSGSRVRPHGRRSRGRARLRRDRPPISSAAWSRSGSPTPRRSR